MKILGIETSCDDTGIAIIEADGKNRPDFKVLSNIVSSQIEVHKKYGGVYPIMAKREHQKNLVPALIEAFKGEGMPKIQNSKLKVQNHNSKLKAIKIILKREPELYARLIPFFTKHEKPDVDLISITNGPGLEPCLWVGVNFAKALAYFWDIPIVAVNHIEAHILVNFLENKKINFPAVTLVVSGGHTQIVLAKGIGKYEIIGETRDDAAGECFDKCARVLGLGYPGGPEIARLAKALQGPSLQETHNLPRPMINSKDYDFSFSGLKTAVLYIDQKTKIKNRKYKQEMATEIQQAIIDVLIKKTIKAAKDYNAKTIILGGGVSANDELRKQFLFKIKNSEFEINFLVPPKNLSTDNGLMIAVAGYFHGNEKILPKNGAKLKKLEASGNLRL